MAPSTWIRREDSERGFTASAIRVRHCFDQWSQEKCFARDFDGQNWLNVRQVPLDLLPVWTKCLLCRVLQNSIEQFSKKGKLLSKFAEALPHLMTQHLPGIASNSALVRIHKSPSACMPCSRQQRTRPKKLTCLLVIALPFLSNGYDMIDKYLAAEADRSFFQQDVQWSHLITKVAPAALAIAAASQIPVWFCIACPVVLGLLAPWVFNLGETLYTSSAAYWAKLYLHVKKSLRHLLLAYLSITSWWWTLNESVWQFSISEDICHWTIQHVPWCPQLPSFNISVGLPVQMWHLIYLLDDESWESPCQTQVAAYNVDIQEISYCRLWKRSRRDMRTLPAPNAAMHWFGDYSSLLIGLGILHVLCF